MIKIDKIGLIGFAAMEAVNCKDLKTYKWFFDSESAEKLYIHYFNHLPSIKEQWEDAKHDGDCIKQCCSCMACFYESEIVETAGVISRALAVASVIGKTQQETLEKAFWKLWLDSDEPPEKIPKYITQWTSWVINKIKEENIVL